MTVNGLDMMPRLTGEAENNEPFAELTWAETEQNKHRGMSST